MRVTKIPPSGTMDFSGLDGLDSTNTEMLDLDFLNDAAGHHANGSGSLTFSPATTPHTPSTSASAGLNAADMAVLSTPTSIDVMSTSDIMIPPLASSPSTASSADFSGGVGGGNSMSPFPSSGGTSLSFSESNGGGPPGGGKYIDVQLSASSSHSSSLAVHTSNFPINSSPATSLISPGNPLGISDNTVNAIHHTPINGVVVPSVPTPGASSSTSSSIPAPPGPPPPSSAGRGGRAYQNKRRRTSTPNDVGGTRFVTGGDHSSTNGVGRGMKSATRGGGRPGGGSGSGPGSGRGGSGGGGGSPPAVSTSPTLMSYEQRQTAAERELAEKKRKHNAIEQLRRERLKTKFTQLRTLTGTQQSDRGSILLAAIDTLQQFEVKQTTAQHEIERLRQKVADSERLIQQLKTSQPSDIQRPLYVANPSNVIDYHDFFLQSDIAMAIARVDGRFLECNRKFEKLTGYARDELLESNMFALTHKQDLPKMFACIRGMLSKKYTLCKSVKKWVRKDGTLFPCSCVISVVANKNDGMPKYFVCFGPSTLHSDDSELEDGGGGSSSSSSSSNGNSSSAVSPALSSASTGSIASSLNGVKSSASPRDLTGPGGSNNNMQIDQYGQNGHSSSSRSTSPRPTSSLGGDRRRLLPPPPPSHAPPPLVSSSSSSNGVPPRVNVSSGQHGRNHIPGGGNRMSGGNHIPGGNMAAGSRMVTNGMHTLSLSSSGAPGRGTRHSPPAGDVKHVPGGVPRVNSYPGSTFPQPQYAQQQQQQQQHPSRPQQHRGSFSQPGAPSAPQHHFQMSMHAARMVAQAAAVTKSQHHPQHPHAVHPHAHAHARPQSVYQSRPPPPPSNVHQRPVLTPHTRLNPVTTYTPPATPAAAMSPVAAVSGGNSAPPPPPSSQHRMHQPQSPSVKQQPPGAPHVIVKREPPPSAPAQP